MGHAERRTSEFAGLTAVESTTAHVTTLFAPRAAAITEPASDGNPKARRIAALLFLGGVVGFWGSIAAAASTFLL